MPAGSNAQALRKPTARSKITNDLCSLPGVDGRSTWVRRLYDLVAIHLSDLGGEGHTSEAEKSIVRRIATLTVELELLELKFAKAGGAQPADLDLYQRTAGNLRRLLESVGLRKRVTDITPDPLVYARDYEAAP
jgi:hypothetical protein